MGQRTKRLLFEIEIAKQRLQFAIESKRDKLAFETQRQLANLNTMLVAETKANASKSEPTALYWLVFSESFQDGIVVSNVAYRALARSMDAEDRATHIAIEIDGPLEAELVEQTVALEATNRRIVKRTA